ncbi:hypothetical protein CH249_24485 [Rhodococcus sp. 05-2255-3B1]|uniref:hypothetical protein n=1 Tax=unclassified Rhodococcus (in: high G+C Gram-positive bacteria) TaxID=192944 RepID=UPI000B9BFD8E|nr:MULTISPECIES: hypothetical protein [unclassified Rhodococcus (in: high G+C Gram-positive bacteria)]OZE06196.1 hypothetical protein CH249_24485 [Rhodococcus sp. 05-2255-3B1]OZE07395.1 hypothetical protein CH250_17840 [Rhodococcus sp. 05-2255-3C]OZE18348.1 hypothetical protein CH255_17755 [Rhodococcus sp. 05-2255-2A2]
MNTPDTGTERPQWNWRQWRIPAKINGRVRTSTVAFGICFVLTGLWYGQVSAEIAERDSERIQGPVAVDPGELTPYTQPQTVEPTYSSTTVTPTPTATTDPDGSGSVDESGQPATTTTLPSTTTAPFGVPLPPVIQSLIPSQPAPTSSR